MKKRNKINLNAYLFANLFIVCVLLVGLWNMQPVWDVTLRFPNLLLILVILNTILIFKEVILGSASRGKQTTKVSIKKKSLLPIRVMVKKAETFDNNFLKQILAKMLELTASNSVAIYNFENSHSTLVASSGTMPSTLEGSKFLVKSGDIIIKYPGNLGEETVGKLSLYPKRQSFKSIITRLEFYLLPLKYANKPNTGICIFAKPLSSPFPISSPEAGILLEMLIPLINLATKASSAQKEQILGLPTFELFEKTFETEIERSERYQQEMTLLSLKIKNFELLENKNKTLVIESLSIALKDSLRRLDHMFCGPTQDCCYAILTETDVKTAEIVAQRIQKVFCKQIEQGPNMINKAHALCIGAATYPVDATHGHGLLEKSKDSLNLAINENITYKSYSTSEEPQEPNNEQQ